MQDIITSWLTAQGVHESYLTLSSVIIACLIILVFCSISFYIAKNYVLVFIHKLTTASKNTWDDLFFDHQVFAR